MTPTRPAATLTKIWGSTDWLDVVHRHQSEAPVENAPSTGFAPGQVFGNVCLIRRLGEGSQAEVWEARPIGEAESPVAIRFLRTELSPSRAACESFLRSAELGRSLSARGVLPTLDLGEEDGRAYQVTPLVQGVTLQEAIAQRRASAGEGSENSEDWWVRKGPSPYLRAMTRVLIQVSQGVAEAHRQGIVHRDIKPSNILIERGEPPRAFLADLGLGRRIDEGDSQWGPSGTPMYMPPERLLGEPCDEIRGDVFSLGITLYEALTLVHPRAVPPLLPRQSIPVYLASQALPRPRSVCPGLPCRLESVILRATSTRPEDRYPDADRLALELIRASRGF